MNALKRVQRLARSIEANLLRREIEDSMPYAECFPECQARDPFVCTCGDFPPVPDIGSLHDIVDSSLMLFLSQEMKSNLN